MSKKKIKIKLMRSACGRKPGHKETVRGLGLRRTGHELMVEDSPEVRGMIKKVSYLVSVVGDDSDAKQVGGGAK